MDVASGRKAREREVRWTKGRMEDRGTEEFLRESLRREEREGRKSRGWFLSFMMRTSRAVKSSRDSGSTNLLGGRERRRRFVNFRKKESVIQERKA